MSFNNKIDVCPAVSCIAFFAGKKTNDFDENGRHTKTPDERHHRAKQNSAAKTNISIDYGFGSNGSNGLFINIGELF